MTDVLTAEQRRRCMASIKGKDTKPEMLVRKIVRSLGYRHTLHHKKLAGKPDIVFWARKKLIFVHGCFWHKHRCRYGKVQPKTNATFWEKKREANRLRDLRNRRELRKADWKILIVWECSTKEKNKIKKLERKIQLFLDQ